MEQMNIPTGRDQIEVLPETLDTTVCVIGSGPGGAFLAFQLARQGIKVLLVERAKSFKREFRGESLSPDARLLLERNGLGHCFTHGYMRTKSVTVSENGEKLLALDMQGQHQEIDYVTDFPQPVLLSGLVEAAERHPSFSFFNGTVPRELLRNEQGQVTGVRLANRSGECRVNCQLVVAADGRYSDMRKLAGVEAKIKKIPRDIVWFSLQRPANWEHASSVNINGSRQIVLLPTYPDGLRVGFNVPPGAFGEFRRRGLEHFQQVIGELEPRLKDAIKTGVTSWDDVQLLDVFTSEIDRWSYDGLVFIGDAAHTLSPIMGQGVKMSLFDAEALARVISARLQIKPDGLICAHELENFEAERRKCLRFIAKFQNRQERLFRVQGRFRSALRRGFYRTIQRLPFIKRRIVREIFYGGLSQMAK